MKPNAIEEYNPVDGRFFLVSDSKGRMVAKTWCIEDARLILLMNELKDSALGAIECFKNLGYSKQPAYKSLKKVIDKLGVIK